MQLHGEAPAWIPKALSVGPPLWPGGLPTPHTIGATP
jgi:hypothetical protein